MSNTYAIGDIHGRIDVLEACLTKIEQHSGGSAKIVFLGDYIDRGPDSRTVVERLMAGPTDGSQWITLGGNHEDMCISAHETPDQHLAWWLGNGGKQTFDSYGGELPADHIEWMRNLPAKHLDEHRLFVHAGVARDVALADQSDDHMKWIRYGRIDEVGLDGLYVVHGHTPYGDGPVILETRCNLDVMSFKTGLGAIAVFDDAVAGKPIETILVRCGYISI